MEKNESYPISAPHRGESKAQKAREVKRLARNHLAQLGHKPVGTLSPHALPLHYAAPPSSLPRSGTHRNLSSGEGSVSQPATLPQHTRLPCSDQVGLRRRRV